MKRKRILKKEGTMEREKLEQAIKACEAEEKELRFFRFGISDARRLGEILVRVAEEREAPAALDIELWSFQVFHSCMDGAAPYNNLWIERKHRMVRTKQISSLHAGYLLEYQGKDLERDWLLNPKAYAVKGGGFPILLEDGSCIGSAACSGLPHEQDHRLITDGIRRFREESESGRL